MEMKTSIQAVSGKKIKIIPHKACATENLRVYDVLCAVLPYSILVLCGVDLKFANETFICYNYMNWYKAIQSQVTHKFQAELFTASNKEAI